MRIEVSIRVDLVPDSEPAKPAPEKPKAPPGSPVVDWPPAGAEASPFPNKNTLNLTDVISLTGLSRGEIESAVALGRLPKPFRRGRGIFWPEDAVRVFVMNRRAEGDRKSQPE